MAGCIALVWAVREFYVARHPERPAIPERTRFESWASYLAYHAQAGLRIPINEPPQHVNYRFVPGERPYPGPSIHFNFTWWSDYELMCTVTSPAGENTSRVFTAIHMMQGNHFGGNFPKDFAHAFPVGLGRYEIRWAQVQDGREGQVLWEDRLNIETVDPVSEYGDKLEPIREIVSPRLRGQRS